MRLIDADELINDLNKNKIEYDSDVNYFIMHAKTSEVLESFMMAWKELRNTVEELNAYNHEEEGVVRLTSFLMGYMDGLHAKYIKGADLKESKESIPEAERTLTPIWKENINRDRVWLRVADLLIGQGDTAHNKIVKAALDRIAEVPKSEASYEDLEDYCKKRDLVVITNELYQGLIRW